MSPPVIVQLQRVTRRPSREVWTLELTPEQATLLDHTGRLRNESTPEQAAQSWGLPNFIDKAHLTLPTDDGNANFKATREGMRHVRAFAGSGFASFVTPEGVRSSRYWARVTLAVGVLIFLTGIGIAVVNLTQVTTTSGGGPSRIGIGIIVAGFIAIYRGITRLRECRLVEVELARRAATPLGCGAPPSIPIGPIHAATRPRTPEPPAAPAIVRAPRGQHPLRVIVWGTLLLALAGLAAMLYGWVWRPTKPATPPPPPPPAYAAPAPQQPVAALPAPVVATPPPDHATPISTPLVTAPFAPSKPGLTGAIVMDDLATSVRSGSLVSADKVWLIAESEKCELFAPLQCDSTQAGRVRSGAPGTAGTIAAGTKVSSYLLHADTPDGATAKLEGQITFSTPILGLIYDEKTLDASDAVVGKYQMAYPNGGKWRGWFDGSTTDWIEISADRLTVAFRSDTAKWVDQIRIVTDAP